MPAILQYAHLHCFQWKQINDDSTWAGSIHILRDGIPRSPAESFSTHCSSFCFASKCLPFLRWEEWWLVWETDGRGCWRPKGLRCDRPIRLAGSRRLDGPPVVEASPLLCWCCSTGMESEPQLILDRCTPSGRKRPGRPWPSGVDPAHSVPPPSPSGTFGATDDTSAAHICHSWKFRRQNTINSIHMQKGLAGASKCWKRGEMTRGNSVYTKSWPRTRSEGSRKNMLNPDIKLIMSSLEIWRRSINSLAISNVAAEPVMAICWT